MKPCVLPSADHLLLGFILCQAARGDGITGGCIHTQGRVMSVVSPMAVPLGSAWKHFPGDVGGCGVGKLGSWLQNSLSTNSYHSTAGKEGEIFYAGSKEIENSYSKPAVLQPSVCTRNHNGHSDVKF